MIASKTSGPIGPKNSSRMLNSTATSHWTATSWRGIAASSRCRSANIACS